MTDENAIAARLLGVVRDIYEEGRAIIGERWSLLRKTKEMADRGDVVGILRYFEDCLGNDRGRRVAEKLRAAGKKTLETEERRIWGIVGEALVEAKIGCVSRVRDAARRGRLAESFHGYWKREAIASAIERAVQQRFQRSRGIVPPAGLRPQLDSLPFVFMRYGGPRFDRLRHLLEQAAEAFLLGLFEASAVLGRAALQVALEDRWDARYGGHAPGGQTTEGMGTLIDVAFARGIITDDQRRLALTVKRAGDSAAHGGEVDGARARSALAALRKLLGEF